MPSLVGFKQSPRHWRGAGVLRFLLLDRELYFINTFMSIEIINISRIYLLKQAFV